MWMIVLVAHAEAPAVPSNPLIPTTFATDECGLSGPSVGVGYTTAAQADAWEHTVAASERRDPVLGKFPGGLVSVRVDSSKIEEVNLERYLLVVHDGRGNAVTRHQPGPGSPVQGVGLFPSWSNRFVWGLSAPWVFPLKVLVTEQGGSRCTWVVGTDGQPVLDRPVAPSPVPVRAPASTAPAPKARPSTILCNDGTRSPSCGACSRGCCSGHGGCK